MDTYNKNKFLTLINFIKFFESYIPQSSCKIYGSFVRQMFEKIFISTLDESGYGNSQNHDVDITIFKSEETYNNNMEMFYNVIDTLELMEKLNTDSNNNAFGEYTVVKTYDLTMNCDYEKRELKRREERISQLSQYLQNYNPTFTIKDMNLQKSLRQKFNGVPHFHIILYNKNDNTYIIIDLLGYPIVDNEYNIDDDIDVNTLYITRDGIRSKSDFFTTIESIIKRRGILKINFESMIYDLKTKTLTFTEKSRIFNNIVNFLGLRTKILGNGYNQIESDTKIIDIYLENNEICEITDLHPPYVGIHLECGHKLSVMALSGIVNIHHNDFSEYIGCPYCREQLIPKLIENNITIQNIPNRDIIQMLYNTGNIKLKENKELLENIPKIINKEIMSKENINIVLDNTNYVLPETKFNYENDTTTYFENNNYEEELNADQDWYAPQNDYANWPVNIPENIFDITPNSPDSQNIYNNVSFI